MVTRPRLMIAHRPVWGAMILVIGVLGMMVAIDDVEAQMKAVFMGELGGMLNAVDHAGGGCAGEHERQGDAEHRDQCPQPRRQVPSHGGMLMGVLRPWQGGEEADQRLDGLLPRRIRHSTFNRTNAIGPSGSPR